MSPLLRWAILSKGKPWMSSHLIMEFGGNSPVLWSITIHNLSECGLGTACTGDTCIPGRRSQLNEPENLPVSCLWSCWAYKKFASGPLSGVSRTSSMIDGYSSLSVSAHGQNPSLRPLQTDSTKRWFGCEASRDLKWSTLIGVTILKRFGWLVIVHIAMAFPNLATGTDGRGLAHSV